jgi:UDP-N-acetylglucosamine 2-epimerase (non-hydrolysing)
MVLITGHRRESFGEGFENICRAIAELARRFPDVQFVYPVHLNPNVREPVYRLLSGDSRSSLPNGSRTLPNIHLLEPLDYLPFVALMNRSTLILTDSGGVQEEAPSLRKPVLVMRDTTERPEAVQAGVVRLVGTNQESIMDGAANVLANRSGFSARLEAHNPYGDGHSAGRIVSVCRRFVK